MCVMAWEVRPSWFHDERVSTAARRVNQSRIRYRESTAAAESEVDSQILAKHPSKMTVSRLSSKEGSIIDSNNFHPQNKIVKKYLIN